MKNSRASERYAKSLLMLAIEKKILDKVKADVDLISKSFEDSREISNLYLSPIIPINHKLSITKKIFKGKVNEHTLNLLTNLVLRKRDNLIDLTNQIQDQRIKSCDRHDPPPLLIKLAPDLAEQEQKEIAEIHLA